MNIQTAQAIIEHNRQVYNTIAVGFDQTRKSLHWPVLERLTKDLPSGAHVLDLGCGTGRLIGYLKDKDIHYTGMDQSEDLLTSAQKALADSGLKGSIEAGECTQIPVEDNTYDALYIIAAFHHVPSKQLRNKAMREMWRVMKPGGTLYMTNWNAWRSKGVWQVLGNMMCKVGLRRRHTPWEHKLEWNDHLAPWKKQHEGRTLYRYYHSFTSSELKRLFRSNGFKLTEHTVDGSDTVYGGRGWNHVTIGTKVV